MGTFYYDAFFSAIAEFLVGFLVLCAVDWSVVERPKYAASYRVAYVKFEFFELYYWLKLYYNKIKFIKFVKSKMLNKCK